MADQRDYIDFKLGLTSAPDDQGACQVSLQPTTVGGTVTPVTVPASERPPAELLSLLASKGITWRNVVKLGRKLANCLLPEGTIRTRFEVAYDRAGPDGGVRLRLIITDHALKQWPWEYVYLDLLGGPDSERGFLALDPRISLVRHEALPRSEPAIVPATDGISDLRLLIVAASPTGQSPLQVEREIEIITEAIRTVEEKGVRIAGEVMAQSTLEELRDALRSGRTTHVFHFAGHGNTTTRRDDFSRGTPKEEGYLLLVEDKATRTEARLIADDLAKDLQRAGTRLAVLGACKSGKRDARYPWDGVAGALTAREIPAVIAMQYEVEDPHAIAFGRELYRGLARGRSLDEVVSLGRQAMWEVTSNLPERPINLEWGVPVLYSRLPDGVLFPELVEQDDPIDLRGNEKLIAIYERRLQKLEEKQAQFGLHVPPHIETEIEDIEAKLLALRAKR